MAITAKLIDELRNAERFPVELDATVRNTAARPYDVVLEDLSSTGFRMVGGPDMPIGSTVSIGFAGIGVQPARLTRFNGDSYGCEFVKSLSAADLSVALNATSAEPIAFPTLLIHGRLGETPEPHVVPYSGRTKLTLAIIMPATLWAIIAGIYWIS